MLEELSFPPGLEDFPGLFSLLSIRASLCCAMSSRLSLSSCSSVVMLDTDQVNCVLRVRMCCSVVEINSF